MTGRQKEEPATVGTAPAQDPVSAMSTGAGSVAAEEAKVLATLQAQFALAGHEMRVYPRGFTVSRWGHVRHFTDLDDVQAFLHKIGGAR